MSHFYLSGLVFLLIKINNLFFSFFFFFLLICFTVMFCRLINEVIFCETRQKDAGPGNGLVDMLLKKCILSWGWHSREASDSIYCSSAWGHYIALSHPVLFGLILSKTARDSSERDLLQDNETCYLIRLMLQQRALFSPLKAARSTTFSLQTHSWSTHFPGNGCIYLYVHTYLL